MFFQQDRQLVHFGTFQHVMFDDRGAEMGLDVVAAQSHVGRFCEILGVGSKNQ